jgi:uncharacterized membrane protein YhaH (DUF805 family)
VNWYVDALKKYVDFNGRARRQAYWMYFLFNVIILVVLAIVSGIIGTMILYYLYGLAIFLPSHAVGVRRLHDTGRSGWFILLELIPLVGSIVLLVFLCSDSQPGHNQYGPNPKEIQPGY